MENAASADTRTIGRRTIRLLMGMKLVPVLCVLTPDILPLLRFTANAPNGSSISRYSRRQRRTLLTVLGLTVGEAFPGGGELSELVPDHLVGDGQWGVVLAIVNLELQANEGRDDSAGAGVGADRDVLGQGLSETGKSDEEWTFPGGSRHGG